MKILVFGSETIYASILAWVRIARIGLVPRLFGQRWDEAPYCPGALRVVPWRRCSRAARELEPDVRLIKLTADEEPRVASELGVAGIPALFLLSGGRVVAQTAGAMDAGRIVSWARAKLAAAA